MSANSAAFDHVNGFRWRQGDPSLAESEARLYDLGVLRSVLEEAVEIAVGADEIGVNGAFFRVHHFAPQAAAPMPLLSAIASRTKAIEVGTGVIDMR